MICSICGGEVQWQGPLSDLTHTKCLSCGAVNSQVRVEAADPTVPAGFEPLEAFYNPTTGICFIHGPLDCNDESHNCDEMGCGSVTPHVTYCGPLPTGNAMPTTSEEAPHAA